MRIAAALLFCASVACADDMGVLRKMSENKFAPMAGLPSCSTLSVESGDPSKGPSVILIKGKAGCVIPWHWHTPTEHVMVARAVAVSGCRNMAFGGSALRWFRAEFAATTATRSFHCRA